VSGMTSRVASTGLLVIVDESEALQHTLHYVGVVVGKRKGFRICLGYMLPSLPTELLEFGGAEDPMKEEKLGKELKKEQKQWLAVARRRARDVLRGAQSVLERTGVPAGVQQTTVRHLPEGRDLADEIVEMAAAHRCHTIVIGRHHVSRFRELFGGDLAEQLVRRVHGPTVWVTSAPPTKKRNGHGR